MHHVIQSSFAFRLHPATVPSRVTECTGLQWRLSGDQLRVGLMAGAASPAVRAMFRQINICTCGARADEYRIFAQLAFALPIERPPLWLRRIAAALCFHCPQRIGLPAEAAKLQRQFAAVR